MNLKWMSKGAGVGLLLLCLLPIRGWSSEYHTFSDTNDRSFEGTIKAFNAAAAVVTIERVDGKTGQMPLSAFAEATRGYILNWGASNDFMKGMTLSVDLKSQSVASGKLDAAQVPERVSEFYYVVQLSNKTTAALNKIAIEYCIFYRQGDRDGSTINYKEGICHGRESVEPLKPSATSALETKSIQLYSEESQTTIFGAADTFNADVRGIWLRLTTTLPSGEKITREYRTSNDSFWKWADYSIGAGLNKGDSAYRFLVK
jgi:hypothetical protein